MKTYQAYLVIAVVIGAVAGTIITFYMKPTTGVVIGCVAAVAVFQALLKIRAFKNVAEPHGE